MIILKHVAAALFLLGLLHLNRSAPAFAQDQLPDGNAPALQTPADVGTLQAPPTLVTLIRNGLGVEVENSILRNKFSILVPGDFEILQTHFRMNLVMRGYKCPLSILAATYASNTYDGQVPPGFRGTGTISIPGLATKVQIISQRCAKGSAGSRCRQRVTTRKIAVALCKKFRAKPLKQRKSPTATPTPKHSSRTPTPIPTPFSTPPPIPKLSLWELNMTKYGAPNCAILGDQTGNLDVRLLDTYYDAQWVFYSIADYTQDSSWLACANAARSVYRDLYLIPNNEGVPGYWIFSRGLTEDFLRTGNQVSQSTEILLSTKAAFAPDYTPLNNTVDAALSREVAYNMESYMNSELLGQPPRARLTAFANQALGHLNQWFVAQSTPYIRPFMVALTSQALIQYYDETQDNRVIPALTLAMDWIWDNMWLPENGTFEYTNVDTSLFPPTQDAYNTGGTEPAPDLNLLIAPVYAWLYHQTGQQRFLVRGDQVFAGGVSGAFLSAGKQYNQNYRWSFDYIIWRTEPPLLTP